jgi:predicted lipoprotein with Yx(FWY)xxD motif
LILSNVEPLPAGSGALLTRRLDKSGSPFEVVNRIGGRYVMIANAKPSEDTQMSGHVTRKSWTVALVGAALLLASAGCSSSHDAKKTATAQDAVAAPPVPIGVQLDDSALGAILTDQNGRTLYAFAKDKAGRSSCSGQCIATWPALTSATAPTLAAGLDKTLLSTLHRTDNADQLVYGGWPLYYYAGDVGPGDVDGQGVDSAWWAVTANGKLLKTTIG